jgi:hypothetical protein
VLLSPAALFVVLAIGHMPRGGQAALARPNND